MDRSTSATCALEGCTSPILRHAGGGRPRLYCSDAHRAEARRRRLRAAPLHGGRAGGGDGEGGGEGTPIDEVRRLLDQARAALDRLGAPAARDDALVAAARAEATAEVLAAQQLAADATRQAAAAHDRLERERAEWQATLRGLADERAAQRAAIDELAGALDGARTELERELVSHHHDVELLEGRLRAEAAAHLAALAGIEHELEAGRRDLAARTAAVEHAERRVAATTAALERQVAMGAELEVRAVRAEEHARRAMQRVARLEAEVATARRTLADARRRHRAELAERRGTTPRRAAGGATPSP